MHLLPVRNPGYPRPRPQDRPSAVVALVRDELELSVTYASHACEEGQPPCHPRYDDGALLLHGCAVGLYLSRRIARACRERVDFMAIGALDADRLLV